jgi:hypothetical protein
MDNTPKFEVLERKGETVVRVSQNGVSIFLTDEDQRRLNAARATFYRKRNEKKLKAPCLTTDLVPRPGDIPQGPNEVA